MVSKYTFEDLIKIFLTDNFNKVDNIVVDYDEFSQPLLGDQGVPERVSFDHQDENHSDPPEDLEFKYRSTIFSLKLADSKCKDQSGIAYCSYEIV